MSSLNFKIKCLPVPIWSIKEELCGNYSNSRFFLTLSAAVLSGEEGPCSPSDDGEFDVL